MPKARRAGGAQATDKKLAGAAKTSFMTKCSNRRHRRLQHPGRRQETRRRGAYQLHQEVRHRRDRNLRHRRFSLSLRERESHQGGCICSRTTGAASRLLENPMGLLDNLGGSLKSGPSGSCRSTGFDLLGAAKTDLGDLNGLSRPAASRSRRSCPPCLGDGKNMPSTAEELRAALGNAEVQQLAEQFGDPVDGALNSGAAVAARRRHAGPNEASAGGQPASPCARRARRGSAPRTPCISIAVHRPRRCPCG